jgi:hypothetical protein
MSKRAFIFSVLLVVGISTSVAQEQEETASDFDYAVSLDLQTRYVWRGLLLGGSSPSMQPGMSFSWKGLSIGTWGAFSFNRLSVQELDLYLSYTFWKERFTVVVTDYCFPDEANDFDYFDYRNATTPHVFEAGFVYNGEEKVPISVGVYCNFYGADTKGHTSGNNLFSSYAEISYNPTFKKLGVDFSVFAGFALNGQNVTDTNAFGEEVHFYGFYNNKGFAFINTGVRATKTFRIGEHLTLPLSTALIFNPNDKKAYLTASVGLAL